MEATNNLLIFLLSNKKFALNLSDVVRVIPSVEITHLPNAPQVVLGIIQLQKQIIPIVNIRLRFQLPPREISLSDHIIIAKTSRRTVGLLVDSVYEVTGFDKHRVVPAEKILPALRYIHGIIQLDDGLVIINDLDQFLSLDEEKELDIALNRSEIDNG